MEYVEVEVELCLAATDRAALCRIGESEYWIPWSQFEEGCGDIHGKGDSGTAYITEWFADKEGIPY